MLLVGDEGADVLLHWHQDGFRPPLLVQMGMHCQHGSLCQLFLIQIYVQHFSAPPPPAGTHSEAVPGGGGAGKLGHRL